MSAPVALTFEGVWKRYDREHARRATLKQAFLDPLGRFRRNWFWALSDVDLRMREGETIGLVGANGAGKSTLLRLAAGLGKPTAAHRSRTLSRTDDPHARRHVRPVLTGRENAISAPIVAGFTRRQAAQARRDRRLRELEEFIEQPLAHLQHGMQLRLAFSVAISVEPEILVIDEVLSVGDMRFQGSASTGSREFQAAGATILSPRTTSRRSRRLCNRALWLQRGGSGRRRAGAGLRGLPARCAPRPSAGWRRCRRPRAIRSRDRPWNERFGTREVEISALRIHPDERASPARRTAVRRPSSSSPRAAGRRRGADRRVSVHRSQRRPEGARRQHRRRPDAARADRRRRRRSACALDYLGLEPGVVLPRRRRVRAGLGLRLRLPVAGSARSTSARRPGAASARRASGRSARRARRSRLTRPRLPGLTGGVPSFLRLWRRQSQTATKTTTPAARIAKAIQPQSVVSDSSSFCAATAAPAAAAPAGLTPSSVVCVTVVCVRVVCVRVGDTVVCVTVGGVGRCPAAPP